MVISFYPRYFRGFFFVVYDAAHKRQITDQLSLDRYFSISHYFGFIDRAFVIKLTIVLKIRHHF